MLAPLAGVTPSGVDTRSVSGAHVVIRVGQARRNASGSPVGLGADAPKFVEVETKATKAAPDAMDGLELAPLPGVTPSAEDTRKVVGEQVTVTTPLHVSQTNICGVTPSKVAFETKFVATDTKAT